MAQQHPPEAHEVTEVDELVQSFRQVAGRARSAFAVAWPTWRDDQAAVDRALNDLERVLVDAFPRMERRAGHSSWLATTATLTLLASGTQCYLGVVDADLSTRTAWPAFLLVVLAALVVIALVRRRFVHADDEGYLPVVRPVPLIAGLVSVAVALTLTQLWQATALHSGPAVLVGAALGIACVWPLPFVEELDDALALRRAQRALEGDVPRAAFLMTLVEASAGLGPVVDGDESPWDETEPGDPPLLVLLTVPAVVDARLAAAWRLAPRAVAVERDPEVKPIGRSITLHRVGVGRRRRAALREEAAWRGGLTARGRRARAARVRGFLHTRRWVIACSPDLPEQALTAAVEVAAATVASLLSRWDYFSTALDLGSWPLPPAPRSPGERGRDAVPALIGAATSLAVFLSWPGDLSAKLLATAPTALATVASVGVLRAKEVESLQQSLKVLGSPAG